MRIQVDQRVHRPIREVYAWCTDYQEADPGLSSVAIRARKVLSRSAGVVELEDSGVLGMRGTTRYVIHLHPPDRWEADAASKMGTGHNEYRLTPDGDGTQVSITFTLRPRGGYRILGAFAHAYLRRRLSRLWADFARDMEEGR